MSDRFLFIDNGFDAFIFIVVFFFFLLHLHKIKDLLRSLRLKRERNTYICFFFLFAIFTSRRKKPIYLFFLEIKIHHAYKLKILIKITFCPTNMS